MACKSIGAGFDVKDQLLDDQERGLTDELNELREKRRALKRELDILKQELKEGEKIRIEPKVDHGTLKSWLIDTDIVGVLQFRKAEKYAEEKNLDLLSALLTLSMISVETFEKAKKMKLRY